MSKYRKALIGCGGMFVLIVVSFMVVEPPYYMLRLPREHWSAYKRWRRVSLPTELNLMKPTPYSEALLLDAWLCVKLYREHEADMKTLGEMTTDRSPKRDWDEELEGLAVKEDAGEPIFIPPSKAPSELLALAEEIASAYQQLPTHPEFDLDVLHGAFNVTAATNQLALDSIHIYSFHEAVAAGHALLALRHLESEDANAAVEVVRSLIASLKFDDFADPFLFQVRSIILKCYLKNLATVLEASEQPEVAQFILDELDSIHLPDRVGLAHNEHYEPIGRARYFIKRGYDASFSDDADMAYVGTMHMTDPSIPYLAFERDRTRRIYLAATNDIESFLSPYADREDLLAPGRYDYEAQADWNQVPFPLRKYAIGRMLPVSYEISCVDWESRSRKQEETERCRAINAQVDLLRIRAAQILFAHATGKHTQAWSDLAPAYFPQPLPDIYGRDGEPYSLAPTLRPIDPNGRLDEEQDSRSIHSPDIELEFSERCVQQWREFIGNPSNLSDAP